MSDVLIRCHNVGKIFCRDLKRSLWYGVQDIADDLFRRNKPIPVSSADVELRKGEFWANKDISFEVERGTAVALVGGNGAGKTTLLKILNGLIKPDAGQAEIQGQTGALIALGAGFNPILTGRENIFVNAAVLGLNRNDIRKRLDDIIGFAGLEEFIDAPVRTYSSGMQVRLGFSIATCIDPDVLLIDEVLAVGDFSFRTRCYGRLAKIASDCAIVFVSHSTPQITRLCPKALLLERGVKLLEGPSAEVIAAYNSREATELNFRVSYDGALKIETVKLHSKDVFFDGPLEFNLNIQSDCKYPNCFLRLLIRRVDAEIVGEWNSELHGQCFTIESGTNEFSFKIPKIRLHDGVYRCQFFVMSEDRLTHLINVADAFEFKTVGHGYGGIAVQL